MTTESYIYSIKLFNLSLDELQYLTVGGVIEYMQEYSEKEKTNYSDEPKVNKATQAHFDAF